MSILSTLVRETYMHLFAEHDYLKDFASQIGAESEPPIIGDLEPESVIGPNSHDQPIGGDRVLFTKTDSLLSLRAIRL
jgi:hypothetical protein